MVVEYELLTPHGWLRGSASAETLDKARILVAAKADAYRLVGRYRDGMDCALEQVAAALAELQACEYAAVRAQPGTDEWDNLDRKYSQALVNWKAANILLDIFTGEKVPVMNDDVEKVRVTGDHKNCSD